MGCVTDNWDADIHEALRWVGRVPMGLESFFNITVVTIKVHCIVVNVDPAVLMSLLWDTCNPSPLWWVELHTQSTSDALLPLLD